MNYHKELKSKNLIGLLQRLLKAGVITMRDSDGKFVAAYQPGWDTPWVHVKHSYGVNCYLWKNIIFEHIVKLQLSKEQWFVPAGCQDCFKVVVRPQSLKQLFALEALQRRLDHPSKCGVELRETVFGNYGGYFYNRGLPEGLECYKKVRSAVTEDPGLGPDVKIILKRGCTEMEHACGRSDEWKITPDQLALEMRISQYFVTDIPVLIQSEHAQDHVHQMWIERAYSIGDITALEYSDGKPLYPELVAYQHISDEILKAEKKKQKDKK